MQLSCNFVHNILFVLPTCCKSFLEVCPFGISACVSRHPDANHQKIYCYQ